MPFGVLALSGRMGRWRGTDTSLMGGETCSGVSAPAGPPRGKVIADDQKRHRCRPRL